MEGEWYPIRLNPKEVEPLLHKYLIPGTARRSRTWLDSEQICQGFPFFSQCTLKESCCFCYHSMRLFQTNSPGKVWLAFHSKSIQFSGALRTWKKEKNGKQPCFGVPTNNPGQLKIASLSGIFGKSLRSSYAI